MGVFSHVLNESIADGAARQYLLGGIGISLADAEESSYGGGYGPPGTGKPFRKCGGELGDYADDSKACDDSCDPCEGMLEVRKDCSLRCRCAKGPCDGEGEDEFQTNVGWD